jgi:hypothetical protein
MPKPQGCANPVKLYPRIAQKTGLTNDEVKAVFVEMARIAENDMKLKKKFYIPLLGVMWMTERKACKARRFLPNGQLARVNQPKINYPAMSVNRVLQKRLTTYDGDIEILEILPYNSKTKSHVSLPQKI